MFFFFSSRRRHTRFKCDWSSDVCSSDLDPVDNLPIEPVKNRFDPLDVSRFVGQINGRRQFDDSLGVCRFDSQDLLLELHTVNALTGLSYEPLDALRKRRQIKHVMRAFSVRHGLTARL